MSRRNDHSREQLREMAADAARMLIITDGTKSLSARKIANNIGYTVGTLYNIYYNLSDIIMHVNARTLDDIYDKLADIPNRYTRPNRVLVELTREYITYASEHYNLWSAVFYQNHEERLPDWYREKVTRIINLFAEAISSLPGRENTENNMDATNVLWAGLHGICLLSMNGKFLLPQSRPNEVLGESLVVNFLNGYINKDESATV